MDKQKDCIYLATIARAVKRFGIEVNKSQNPLMPLLEKTEEGFSSLIDEAEILASGLSSHEFIEHVPNRMMDCLLEEIGNNTKETRFGIAAHVIALNQSTFPSIKQNCQVDFSHLRDRLQSNINHIQKDNPRVCAENILQLLFRYASSVPANDKIVDISLYDQTRIAAALATCLFEQKSGDSINADKPFIIIGADFSGIQDYIYQIVSKHAGKNLKGRSFYLRLLSDAVVSFLLKTLNLYNANVIYDSGGCFYLLAPNTKETKEKLNLAIQHIEKQLFHSHGTTLFVAIDSVDVSKEEISNQSSSVGLRNIWQLLFTKRDKKKYCKFAEQIQNNYSDFFIPKNIDGRKRDAITGNDFSLEDKPVKFNGDQLISTLNDQQIKLGRDLKDCDCIIASDIVIENLKGKTHIQPAGIGRYYYLLSLKELKENVEFFKQRPEDTCIKLLNGRRGDCDYLFLPEMTYCPIIIDFYGGNTFNGNTFEEMCDNSQLKRLGILRMDVDNLGNIFQNGIPQEKASLARYAALSRSFDYFFSGYINSIVLQDENVDKSFIIYSGGDDLFIVGEWNKIIQIAKTIREDFNKYTCGNPLFSISGGIAILNTKFPIIAGAEESANEESLAKKHSCHGKEKDSISFMDTPLHWCDEFPAVEKLRNCLVELLINDKLPKSFLSKVLLHASTANIINHRIMNVKTYWIMSYDMKRVIERTKNEEVKKLASNCQKEIWENGNHLNGEPITTDYHILELWAFACRWAELEYRMLNN